MADRHPPDTNPSRPRPGALPSVRRPGEAARCSECDAPLTPHQEVSGGVCDERECLRRLAVLHARQADERRKEEQRGLARDWFADLRADQPERYPEDAHVVVVPTNLRTLSPLPEERRTALAEHITGSIAAARGQIEELDGEPWYPPTAPFDHPVRDRDLDKLGSACAACRGQCCVVGEEHAFLSYEVFVPRFLAEPDLSPDDLRDEYLDFLPEVSFEGACVYQGELGCTLPREMRSSVCNSFLCESLLTLRDDLVELEPKRVFAVTMVRESIRGGALLADGRLEFRADEASVPEESAEESGAE